MTKHHGGVRDCEGLCPCAGSAVWCKRERVLLWGVLGETENPWQCGVLSTHCLLLPLRPWGISL